MQYTTALNNYTLNTQNHNIIILLPRFWFNIVSPCLHTRHQSKQITCIKTSSVKANELSKRVSVNVPGAAVVSLLERASDRLCGYLSKHLPYISAEVLTSLSSGKNLLCCVLSSQPWWLYDLTIKCVMGASGGLMIVMAVRVCMLELLLSFDGSTLMTHIQHFKGH